MTLDKELQFIRSYINLMALRLSDNTRLTVSIHDGGTNGLEIAPMMFISLVENAFKHGVSAGSESFIDIRITLDGNRICCHVENSLFRSKSQTKAARASDLPTCSANWSCSTPKATTTAPPPSATATWQSYR